MFGSAAARFTFSFAGYFEGATPSGPLTVAGAREDIVFSAGGVTEFCSSNEQPWTAAHVS